MTKVLFSEMYARLSLKMGQISPKVQDGYIKNAEGGPVAGGQLIRKYLLNRCQEDFEQGWVPKMTGEKSELYSDEHCAAARTGTDPFHWGTIQVANADGNYHARMHYEAPRKCGRP
jgi:hypothetical protein